MPAGALFKLSEAAIEEIALQLDRHEELFAKRYSRDSAWTESGFSRDLYSSLKRREDDWRGSPTVDKVAEALGRRPSEVVRLVKMENRLLPAHAYFGEAAVADEKQKRLAAGIGGLTLHQSDFLEAVIGLIKLPEFQSAPPVLVVLDTGGYGIAKAASNSDNEALVRKARARKIRPKKTGLDFASSSPTGVITVSFLSTLDTATRDESPQKMPLPALYDLSVALGVLPSFLIDRNSAEYGIFKEAEAAAIAKLEQSP